MNDYMIRAAASDGRIRAFAAYTRETVEYARTAHNTSPVITAGLGRLLTAGAMMGSMMKGEKDVLTIRAEGNGPAGYYLVTADSHGSVKGYAANPYVILPANKSGKLNVGGSLGTGILTVIKDLGLSEPYTGTCELISGEIAEDITYYFASSEQTPSSVGLGVLMTPDNTVDTAGGFIIQVMPGADDDVISEIENKISRISSVTDMLKNGAMPEQILENILSGCEFRILDKTPVAFCCGCSKEKVSKALIAVGTKELNSIIEEGNPIEVKCHFCAKAYNFDINEIKELKYEAENP